MISEKGKNGIELEGYVQDSSLISEGKVGFKHRTATSLFEKQISPRFYYDDGKPEYPSQPHDCLENLILEVKEIISRVNEICTRRNWYYTLIGCHPFAVTYASLHVHTSLKAVPQFRDIETMRAFLLDLQPFIALLSQNSPAYLGGKAPVKDVRLAFSDWSQFTASLNPGDSHYLSLADGRDAYTLECRIPSSCSLTQAEAVLVFIKTMIELGQTCKVPIDKTRKMFYRVLKYGGEALVPLIEGKKITYLGLENEVLVPIHELFKLWLKDKTVASVRKEIISELPQEDRGLVENYFKFIASGLTTSDFMLKLFEDLAWDIKEISKVLSEITISSYINSTPFWKFTGIPEKPPILEIKGKITVTEAQELIEKKILPVKFKRHVDLDNLLFSSKYSLKKCLVTRKILKRLSRTPGLTLYEICKDLPVHRRDVHRILKFLVKRKVLEWRIPENLWDDVKYYPGKHFNFLIQLALEKHFL